MLDLLYFFYCLLAERSLGTQRVTCSPQTGDQGLKRSNSEECFSEEVKKSMGSKRKQSSAPPQHRTPEAPHIK